MGGGRGGQANWLNVWGTEQTVQLCNWDPEREYIVICTVASRRSELLGVRLGKKYHFLVFYNAGRFDEGIGIQVSLLRYNSCTIF